MKPINPSYENDSLLFEDMKRNDAFKYVRGYSRPIIKHFMKVWLYSYRYSIDHWVDELGNNYITSAPTLKPKGKIFTSASIIDALNNPKFMNQEKLKKTMDSVVDQYKPIYDSNGRTVKKGYEPRSDYEASFSDFQSDLALFISLLAEELETATKDTSNIDDDTIREILKDRRFHLEPNF